MNNYVDEWGRYHHKPVTESNPIPSNNGWIYTSYAAKLGLPIDKQKLWNCYQASFVNFPIPHITRSPGKPLPPISREEVLGIQALLIPTVPKSVEQNIWSFSPRLIPKFNLFILIKQLREARGKHRNYFWQNNLDQIYRFAFSVPLVDRHFILKTWGKFNLFYWAIAKIDSLSSKESGIRWLKYGKSLQAMQSEFPEDHPIRGVK